MHKNGFSGFILYSARCSMPNYALVFNVIYSSICVFINDLNQMAVSPLISYLINIVLFNPSLQTSVEHFILTSQEIKNCENLGEEI